MEKTGNISLLTVLYCSSKYLSLFLRFFPCAVVFWFRNLGGCTMDFQQELIAEYDREAASTRKMLAAIPADADFTYKPHPKSMSLGNLAGHIAETTAGDWAIEIRALRPGVHRGAPGAHRQTGS
jgi:hypothetical protein